MSGITEFEERAAAPFIARAIADAIADKIETIPLDASSDFVLTLQGEVRRSAAQIARQEGTTTKPIPDFDGTRVWVLQESERPFVDYTWVGVATSLTEAQGLADRRTERYHHGEIGRWVPQSEGMRGPSSYRRHIDNTNVYCQYQRIEQAFLNGGD